MKNISIILKILLETEGIPNIVSIDHDEVIISSEDYKFIRIGYPTYEKLQQAVSLERLRLKSLPNQKDILDFK